MRNPYKIDLPGVVSFSGGRTSGFLLRHVLDAYGGQPEGLVVSFQNTGLEHPATYDFVVRVAEEWGVDIKWLEYDLDGEGEHSFRQVTPETASRKGEPFTKLIKKRGYLPNPVSRICSVNLKMRTLDRYLQTLPSHAEGYTNAIGLRYDEPRRALRAKGDNAREEVEVPMYHARHTEEDVLAFWKQQAFDLELPLTGNMAGNCVGCFLKSRGKLEWLMKYMPEHFDWWIQAERDVEATSTTGGKFHPDRPFYREMISEVQAQGWLYDDLDDDTIPCMCTD